MSNQPIELDFKKSVSSGKDKTRTIRTFNSYMFNRNILVPAAAFRFTAPGIDKSERTAIRSGDMVTIWCFNSKGNKFQLGTGFVDETDTHIQPKSVEYVISGRDTLGQLVDNAAVDADNKIQNEENVSLEAIATQLLKNTRMPQQFVPQQLPNGKILWRTNAGETKISVLQRYLEFTNCVVWTKADGRMVIGKPNFAQKPKGKLRLSRSNPSVNNCIEARARRNLNQSIRKIVTQLQSQDQVDAGVYTKLNNDRDMKKVSKALVGRSVYRHFDYGSGADAVNTVIQVGNQSGNPQLIGDQLSLRELARENMKVLEVEVVVVGHFNENAVPYNIDQVYDVDIEDDDVKEPMYVYDITYELTMEHGMLTRMKLCRLGTIVANADAMPRANFAGPDDIGTGSLA